MSHHDHTQDPVDQIEAAKKTLEDAMQRSGEQKDAVAAARKALSDIVRKRRMERMISISTLAQASQTGPSTICRAEKADMEISNQKMLEIANGLTWIIMHERD